MDHSKIIDTFETYHKANCLIEEHEERICELESFARDDATRITELEEALDNSLCLKDSIEETYTLDLSKMMGDCANLRNLWKKMKT